MSAILTPSGKVIQDPGEFEEHIRQVLKQHKANSPPPNAVQVEPVAMIGPETRRLMDELHQKSS